ncbi:MAG: hypothetical protein F6K30_08905 [Cyanothece sp. SIO2G6]|nr:hypothetical protein [Cyanothece sp. SIO2G6]
MRTLDQELRYQKLELVSSRSLQVPSPLASWKTRLNQVCQGLLQVFTISNEPRIWTRTSKDGQTSWHIYDPVNQRRLTLMSEEEVRVWLDTRHNR